MRNDTLLAIPFFTFMGIVLEKSGMAEDLLDTVGQLFGPVRGGLAFAVILVGALLAATTGVVAASVMAMGLISLPIMLRYGYDRPVATGVIAASGTLAQIIPPSLVLIVLADQLGRSVGDLYAGALIPGLLLTGLYGAYIGVLAIFRPEKVPALPKAARTLSGSPVPLLVLLLLAVAVGRLAYWLLSAMCRRVPASGPPRWPSSSPMAWRWRTSASASTCSPIWRAASSGAGAAAGPHLPGAGHHLPRRRHAHRGRRHGCGGRTGARHRAPPLRLRRS